uniref:Uncharacterized protein n=1 Tax=Tanacetum cinerariifolium TaxID=118510 RepID=A0A6L2MLU5_TANCI|nr:hypothetical protein [Tanacetum cinerariifolium]
MASCLCLNSSLRVDSIFPEVLSSYAGGVDAAVVFSTVVGRAGSSRDEDDDVVVLENIETKEDVKVDESSHNKERYTFEDDNDDGEFDELD